MSLNREEFFEAYRQEMLREHPDIMSSKMAIVMRNTQKALKCLSEDMLSMNKAGLSEEDYANHVVNVVDFLKTMALNASQMRACFDDRSQAQLQDVTGILNMWKELKSISGTTLDHISRQHVKSQHAIDEIESNYEDILRGFGRYRGLAPSIERGESRKHRLEAHPESSAPRTFGME